MNCREERDFKFPVDAGFLCDQSPVTTVVVRGTIK
jgi:hypothetical protein